MDSQLAPDHDDASDQGLTARHREIEALEQERRALSADVADARRTLAALTIDVAAAEARHAEVAESTLIARQRRDTLASEVIALCAERADLLEQVSALRIAAIELDPGHLLTIPTLPIPVAPVGDEATSADPLATKFVPADSAPAAVMPKVAVIAAPSPPPTEGAANRRGTLRSSSDRAVATWVARAQTTVKPRNDTFGTGTQAVSRRNEDRLRLTETPAGLVAAIADGAGASGLFCGAWAEMLVSRLPDDPVTDVDGLNHWLDGFCQEFRTTISARCKSDPPKHSKFVREGSCATLVGCWLAAGDDGATAHWLGHGDSPFLVFDRGGPEPVLVHGHPDRLIVFDRDPHLLNWKTIAEPARLSTGGLALPARATVVLASDGIGLFVLLRHLAASAAVGALSAEFRELAKGGDSRLAALARAHAATPANSAAEALDALRESLATEAAFVAMVAAKCGDGLLTNDDSSVILIDIERTPA